MVQSQLAGDGGFYKVVYSVNGIREKRADILKTWEQVKAMRLENQAIQHDQVNYLAQDEQ
jgi:hypothetical protein